MKTSKVNCKHQKSIANSKIWIQFWEQIAISVCFCCCSERKRREIVTMNLRSHATPRIEHFHQKAMFIKVHLDFVQCSLAPGPIKGSGAQKQRPHKLLWTLWFEKRVYLCRNPNFLKKKLKFQLTFGSSNWLSLVAIDFTQSTWFTTSKVNCKNISEFLSKNFPIQF